MSNEAQFIPANVAKDRSDQSNSTEANCGEIVEKINNAIRYASQIGEYAVTVEFDDMKIDNTAKWVKDNLHYRHGYGVNLRCSIFNEEPFFVMNDLLQKVPYKYVKKAEKKMS